MPKVNRESTVVKANALTGSNEGSQARITCEPRVVNCLDTLKLSLWVDWSGSYFLDRLEAVKQKAQEGEDTSEPVDLGGHQWNCMRSGTSQYTFRLIRGDIKLLLNRRKADSQIPNVRLEVGSLSCWSPGYLKVYQEIIKMIELYGGSVCKERISEVHLAADFIGTSLQELPIKEQSHWITRAHSFSLNFDRRKFSGATWGKGNFMLRIYDKVLELKKSTHKQEVFQDVWGLESFDSEDVTRVEFQIRRPVLRDFAPVINTMEDLQESLTSLWQYCSNNWCRLATHSVDRNHNQSKAETHPFWELVQQVKWVGKQIVIRAKQYLNKDLKRLRQQLAGLGMTISAMMGRKPDDLDGVIAFAQGSLEGDLRNMYHDRKEFNKRMQRKINECFGPFSDQNLVAV